MATKAESRKEERNGPRKTPQETKNCDVAKTIEPHRTIDQIPDATRADECFAGVADEPAKNHLGRNVALQLHRQMRRKCRQQYHPPNSHRREKERRQQNGIRRPKNRNRMGPEGQREPNFCPEVIGEQYAQRDARNAPIKKLSVTSLCLWMRTKPCQPKWRGQVFHPSNSLLLMGEEVGSIMLISHKENWLSRGGTKQDCSCYNQVTAAMN